jgi:hypothetical protein
MGAAAHEKKFEQDSETADCSARPELISTQVKSWLDEVILPILLQELLHD